MSVPNHRFVSPFAAGALALAAAACGSQMNVRVGDEDGVPLAQLDTSGAAPSRLVLAGPDTITVAPGERLTIDVAGDAPAVAGLRFTLKDGTLGMMRAQGSKAKGTARVTVTSPKLRELVLAGSGDIRAQTLGDDAEVTIAGSGTVGVARIAAQKLDVNVIGSGKFQAAGSAKALDLTVAGSGALAGRELRVDTAKISLVGSGSGEFASDGTVDASIAGSGDVVVHGRARCEISAMGSGSVQCRDDGGARASPR